jgi:peptide deformylase
MPVKIVQKDNKILRKTAEEVAVKDIGTPKIKKVIADMKKALASQDDGVAIAAPQIGVSLRIFVVSGKTINYIKGDEELKEKYPDLVFINPKILKYSKEKKLMEEGCLSVRYLYGKVKRSAKVQISGYDEMESFFRKGATGLMAQIFQHETDHLDGILFTDFAKEIEEITPEMMAARSHKIK